MAVENIHEIRILMGMLSDGMGRPCGRNNNPDWQTALVGLDGTTLDTSNEALWPDPFPRHDMDGIRRGTTDIDASSIAGKGAFMDILSVLKGKPVFWDIKGLGRPPYFGKPSKTRLYHGNSSGTLEDMICEGEYDYVLGYTFPLQVEPFKVEQVFFALNLTRAWACALETNRPKFEGADPLIIKRGLGNSQKVDFCPRYVIGRMNGRDEATMHTECLAHLQKHKAISNQRVIVKDGKVLSKRILKCLEEVV